MITFTIKKIFGQKNIKQKSCGGFYTEYKNRH